jgi:hypothetical protein
MTEEHFAALMTVSEAKKDSGGWYVSEDGRHMTLYAASSGGANLTVSRVEAAKVDKGLVQARTTRGEVFILALEDVFAGAVDTPKTESRKAGFASGV